MTRRGVVSRGKVGQVAEGVADAIELPDALEVQAIEADGSLKPGYVRDYVSGLPVKASPEELEAVQVFAQRLVEDYSYPKERIQTRPQFRVRIRPSDEGRAFPIDIAVFGDTQKIEDNLFLVVECKKKNRKDGVAQLKLYLDMSPAVLGVWFNGDEHIYLRKVLKRDGTREYRELPNIPRYGQRIEDIGLFKRKDLVAPSNLKAVFRDLRNHLAGMSTGITRDEALAQEIINILFCKILDEQETEPDDTVTFRAGIDEPAAAVKKRLLGLFESVKTKAYYDVFTTNDTINLDAESVRYVVGELQNYCVMDADRDAIGDAFEVFIGPALRGAEGQFFTPRNVVQMMVEMLDPKPGERIIDPACGSGGFLITALAHVWERLRGEAKRKGWSERQRLKREVEVATECFRGLDKDAFLAKVCKAYMALIGDGRGGVFCENSLNPPSEWSAAAQSKIVLGTFDVVLTNPPFGAKIPVKGAAILSQFDLGFKWERDKATKAPAKSTTLMESRPPQIVFLERCLQLLKPGGRMGIVLPESILGNPSYEFLMTYLQGEARILGVVTMPESLFKTSGKGGTHTKVAVLLLSKETSAASNEIFMGDVKWCGHDSRGNPTLRKNAATGQMELLDEVPLVAKRYAQQVGGITTRDHLGFSMRFDAVRNRILVPKYYDPEIERDLKALEKTHELTSIGQLQKSKALSLGTGIEVGKMAYGTGTIPFIRTSDLSNWELKADFKHGISQEIYDELKARIDVLAGDILLVRDGTYLIGTSAIVTEADLPMLFQSHLYRIRSLKPGVLNPWLLFAALNSPIVKRQIRSKQFTQDIIDTIGKRLTEVVIPFPKDAEMAMRIASETKEVIQGRAKLRDRAKALALEIQGLTHASPEDLEVLAEL
jgi:type I restriction enzyme M protein